MQLEVLREDGHDSIEVLLCQIFKEIYRKLCWSAADGS